MSPQDVQSISRDAVPCVKVDAYTAACPHGCYSADNPAEGTAPAHALLVRHWGQADLGRLCWHGCCHEVFLPVHHYCPLEVSREIPLEPVPRLPARELPVQLSVYLVMPVTILLAGLLVARQWCL